MAGACTAIFKMHRGTWSSSKNQHPYDVPVCVDGFGRMPVATDMRNWRWATLSAVMAGRDGVVRTVVQWFCRTLIYFRTGVYVLDPNVPYRLIRATVLRRGLDQVPADFNLQNLALSCVLKARVKATWALLPSVV